MLPVVFEEFEMVYTFLLLFSFQKVNFTKIPDFYGPVLMSVKPFSLTLILIQRFYFKFVSNLTFFIDFWHFVYIIFSFILSFLDGGVL